MHHEYTAKAANGVLAVLSIRLIYIGRDNTHVTCMNTAHTMCIMSKLWRLLMLILSGLLDIYMTPLGNTCYNVQLKMVEHDVTIY